MNDSHQSTRSPGKRVNRQTVSLDEYPDLVVIYLGMRVNALTGLKTMFGLGPQISKAVAEQPDGLLLHENLIFSLFPPHLGMRQYWRDWESLEAWTRSEPHRRWWQNFLRDSGGTGFWHETYSMKGGIEAVYGDVPRPTGMMKFAPLQTARGGMFTARNRLKRGGQAKEAAAVPESEYYAEQPDGTPVPLEGSPAG